MFEGANEITAAKTKKIIVSIILNVDPEDARKLFILPSSVTYIGAYGIGGMRSIQDIYICGSLDFNPNIFCGSTNHYTPESLRIHTTQHYKNSTFGGRNVTDGNYSGYLCPKHSSCIFSFSYQSIIFGINSIIVCFIHFFICVA